MKSLLMFLLFNQTLIHTTKNTEELIWKFWMNLKKQLPCAAYLNGEYGVKNIYAGVPVIIGSKGVEKVVELELSEEEKEKFNNSIKSVNELFEAAKKLDNTLI